jgi:hypothetical protein
MKKQFFVGLLMILLFPLTAAFPIDKPTPALHEDFAQTWDDIGRELREWLGRWREHFGSGGTAREERPLISTMLRNRERLGLSADQVKNLEQLRDNFQKESIRKEADLRVAEMDLNSLLEAQPVEMTKVEAKVREIERLRADLRLARIRTIEKGKDQLTADQRKKLQDLLSDRLTARSHPTANR